MTKEVEKKLKWLIEDKDIFFNPKDFRDILIGYTLALVDNELMTKEERKEIFEKYSTNTKSS